MVDGVEGLEGVYGGWGGAGGWGITHYIRKNMRKNTLTKKLLILIISSKEPTYICS